MKKILIFSLCAIALALGSCSKPGKGGKAILSVHVFEGPIPPQCCSAECSTDPSCSKTVVPQAIVYIKYGGTSVDHDASSYDDSQIADYGGKVIFESLKTGDYYLYAMRSDGTKTGGTYFDIENKIGEREVVIFTGVYE